MKNVLQSFVFSSRYLCIIHFRWIHLYSKWQYFIIFLGISLLESLQSVQDLTVSNVQNIILHICCIISFFLVIFDSLNSLFLQKILEFSKDENTVLFLIH